MIGKCAQCGKRRKLYYLSFDPDVATVNRCKDCTDEVRMQLLVDMFGAPRINPRLK